MKTISEGSLVKSGSSHAKVIAIAQEQGWLTVIEKSGPVAFETTFTDPNYVAPEADVPRQTREVTKAIVARFDLDGKFVDAHALLVQPIGGDLRERRWPLKKFSEVKGRVSLGPKYDAERKAQEEATTLAAQERRAQAKVLLDAAAETEEIKSIKFNTGSELRSAEQNLKDALNAIISEAQTALEAIEADRKTGQSFGKLFGHSLDNAVEYHGRRNGLLDMKWHLARLFGDEGLDPTW